MPSKSKRERELGRQRYERRAQRLAAKRARRRRRLLLGGGAIAALAVLAGVIVVALAGGSDQPGTATTAAPGSSPTASPSPAAARFAAGDPRLRTKPTVQIPPGPAPTLLVTEDLIVGRGPAAAAEQPVSVQYVGVARSTRKQFDASWDRGAEPFTFPLGQGQVIKGWDQGVAGMRVGGRRQLLIPPALGYGAAGDPPSIGPNETLVFVVDLVSVG